MYYPVLLLPNGTELKGGSPRQCGQKPDAAHCGKRRAGIRHRLCLFGLHRDRNLGEPGRQPANYCRGHPDLLPAGRCREPHQGGHFLCRKAHPHQAQQLQGHGLRYHVQAGCGLLRLVAGQSGAVPQDHLAAGSAGLPAGRGHACQQQPAHQRQLQRAGVLRGRPDLPPDYLLGGGSSRLLRPYECRRQAAILDLHRQAQHGQNHSGRCQQHRLLC